MATEPGGSKPIAFGVVAAILAVLIVMPGLALVGFYTLANIHAIVVGTDFSSDTMHVGAFFVGLVLTVTAIVVVMAVLVGWIGRGLSPKRRTGDEWGDVDPTVPEP